MAESIFYTLAKALMNPVEKGFQVYDKIAPLVQQATQELQKKQSVQQPIPTKQLKRKQNPKMEDVVPPKLLGTESGKKIYENYLKYKPFIDKIYDEYPNMKQGYMDSLVMQESTMGTNLDNPSIVNLTPIARKDLERVGYKGKYKLGEEMTDDDYLKAAAAFSNIYTKGGAIDENIYSERYLTPSSPLYEPGKKKFKEYIDFYGKSLYE